MPGQVRFTYRGQNYNMPWDSLNDPTLDDIKNYIKTFEPPSPTPITEYPKWKSGEIPNPASLVKPTEPTSFVGKYGKELGSRLYGMGEMVGKGLTNPVLLGAETGESIRQNIENIPEEPGIERYSRMTAVPLDVLGLPATGTIENIKNRNYPGLAADATLLAAGGLLGKRAFARPKMVKEAPSFYRGVLEKPSEINIPFPDERYSVGAKSQPKLLGEADIPSPFVKPETRFVQGRAGTVDVNAPPKVDIGPIRPDFSGRIANVPPEPIEYSVPPDLGINPTVTQLELGEVTTPAPEITAEYGASLGKPITTQTPIERVQEYTRSVKSPFAKEYERPTSFETVNEQLANKLDTMLKIGERQRTTNINAREQAGKIKASSLFGEEIPSPVKLSVNEKFETVRGEHPEWFDENGIAKPEFIKDLMARYKQFKKPTPTPAEQAAQRNLDFEALQKQRVAKAQKNAPPSDLDTHQFSPDVLEAAKASGMDDAVKALEETPEYKPESGRPLSFKETILQADRTTLEKQGPAGKLLVNKVFRDLANKGERLTRWHEPLIKVMNKMPSKLRENFADYYEGKTPIPKEFEKSFNEAVSLVDKLGQEMGLEAETSGMRMKDVSGKMVPFERIKEKYWPRRLPEEAFKDKSSFIDKLVAGGYTRQAANTIYKGMRQFGEIVTPGQHRRIGDLMGYRKDFDTFVEHAEGMAKHVSRTEQFGPRDIGGKGTEGIADLIEQTKNPQATYQILQRYLGRDTPAPEWVYNLNNKARAAETWLHLGMFRVSNWGSQIANKMSSSMKNFGSELVKGIARDSGQKEIAQKAGTQYHQPSAAVESTMGPITEKVFGLSKSESMQRRISAGTGVKEATDLFNAFKKNPTDVKIRQRLQNLVLEDDMNALLKQKELNPTQLRYAAAQQSALTQGLPSSIMVPHGWSNPGSQTFLIFQKYAFQGTKAIKDAIVQSPHPSVKLAELALLSQIFGETIGDVKAGIYGAGQSAIRGENPLEGAEQRIKTRQDWIKLGQTISKGTNYVIGEELSPEAETIVNRFVANSLAGWALGIYGDVFQSLLMSSGSADLAAKAIGPFYNDIGRIITDAINLNAKDLARTVIPTPFNTMIFPPKYATPAESKSGPKRTMFKRSFTKR